MQYQNHEILFSGNDLMATYLDAKSDISVIIFNGKATILDNGKYVPFENMPIMGNNVFAPIGINEIHIFPNRANWYQTEEIYDIAKIVTSRLKDNHYVTYGSSMGGFAAINFSQLFRCDFIAFSPQATLKDPFPISQTWEFAKKSYPDFNSMICNGNCSLSKGLCFFDHKNVTDSYHGMYIKRNTSATIINIPYSNHETIKSVNNIIRVKTIVKQYLMGDFSLKEFKRRFFPAYKKSPDYIYTAYNKNKLYNTKDIEYALQNNAKNYKLLSTYGTILYNNKKYFDAYMYLSKSLKISPSTSIEIYILIYNSLKKLNRRRAATIFFENAPIEHYIKYGNLFLDYRKMGDIKKSDKYLLKALSLHPNKVEYMKKLLSLLKHKKLDIVIPQ